MSCPCDLPQPQCITNCPPEANSKIASQLCTQLFSDNTRKILNKIKNTTSNNEKNKLRAFLNLSLLWPPEKKQLKVYFIITKDEFPYIQYSIESSNSIDPLDKQIKASGKLLNIGNPPNLCLTKVDAVKYVMLILNERYNKFLGIKFVQTNNIQESDIRVTFNLKEGTYSYVGNDAEKFPKNELTMNLQIFDISNILHEFGHALGLLHEHQSPNMEIKWNYPCVCADLANQLSPQEICVNVFQEPLSNNMYSTKYDPLSIMLYSYPPSYTTDCKGVSRNLRLSKVDVLTLAKYYPGGDMSPQDFYKYAYGEDISTGGMSTGAIVALVMGILFLISIIYVYGISKVKRL